MTDRQTVEELLDQAYTLIQQGEAEQAIALGNQLLERRYARGFEVIALAYQHQGRQQEAVDILKEGVAKVPNAWPLWELLGNICSDMENQQGAREAYQKALACPGVDVNSVNYNCAVMLKREGKFDEAFELLRSIDSAELHNKVSALKLSLYNSLGKYDDAIEYGNSVVGEILGQSELPDEDMQDLARAYAELGRAHWEARYDRQAAWENAWKALEWDRSENSALWLVRDIIGRKSPQSRWYKLVIEGQWHFPLEQDKAPPGFITTYEVVADNPEEALQFAQDLEPVEVRASMSVDSNEDLGSFPENEQGVYWRSPYGFYLQQASS